MSKVPISPLFIAFVISSIFCNCLSLVNSYFTLKYSYKLVVLCFILSKESISTVPLLLIKYVPPFPKSLLSKISL